MTKMQHPNQSLFSSLSMLFSSTVGISSPADPCESKSAPEARFSYTSYILNFVFKLIKQFKEERYLQLTVSEVSVHGHDGKKGRMEESCSPHGSRRQRERERASQDRVKDKTYLSKDFSSDLLSLMGLYLLIAH